MTDTLDALIAASRDWDGESPDGRILSTTRSFLTAAKEDHAFLERAAASLDGMDRGAASWIAIACGSLVEDGAPADVSGPALFEHFRKWLPEFPVAPEVQEDGDTPEQPVITDELQRLFKLFQFLCQAVVAHLARLPMQREAMGHDAALLDRLGNLGAWSFGALWVREALTKRSDTLLLLHVQSRTGVRLKYTNVANCFHLFSLLQTAVGRSLPGGRGPNANIAAVARGQKSESVADEAWWHYGNPLSPTSDIRASIWGEGLTREIPSIEGQQVILLWPPILQSRSWDHGFMQPHLQAMPADAVVERALTSEEVESWLSKLKVNEPRKSRWKLW